MFRLIVVVWKQFVPTADTLPWGHTLCHTHISSQLSSFLLLGTFTLLCYLPLVFSSSHLLSSLLHTFTLLFFALFHSHHSALGATVTREQSRVLGSMLQWAVSREKRWGRKQFVQKEEIQWKSSFVQIFTERGNPVKTQFLHSPPPAFQLYQCNFSHREKASTHILLNPILHTVPTFPLSLSSCKQMV